MTKTASHRSAAPPERGGQAPDEPRRAGRARRRVVATASVLVLAAAWYLATEVFAMVTPLVLPSPVDVVTAGVSVATEPYSGSTLAGHVWASLQTVLGGWLLAIVIGVPLGSAMGSSKIVDTLAGPVFNVLRPIPPIAWIPLAIVWFGIGQGARFFVVFLAAAIPCVINAREGVRQVDPVLLRAARTLGAGTLTTVRRVALPSAAPLTFTGIRLSLGNAWMTLVGAELVAASAGLGFLLLDARRSLQPDLLFAAMLVIGLLGALFGAGMRWLEPRLVPWEAGHRDR
ncbi:ABC transporter permease [Jiangella asiatica]|uniref:ABC transporter permease n=1 Tax=Jiangella asiatica TaxID=2530372 RepID=A0A4R5CNB5_9ACTN|nr:ABC transporter permease [Jiangella asiatica]TDE00211.1 ABC transporter permease [Jiangella asiatica]